ncbi:ribonuclease R [Natrialba chahannaoensis JCM 10990]|uniref:Ribonuclease R n=1 Tax=Natrialba chahannaoensis JCM 10990 TaxID=1227492 RepID=M0AWC5_9EURY|nr:NrpR regulatory domain-containing protein [Natrialba chahannaoensis]ELZ02971.1 ribonuclease R [Natrialba chahannaoensis JCM 10990]
MTSDPDRRTYDILRLLAAHEPIGSVHLTNHLRERGYSITERTVRLTLADLDDAGLTEKAGGKGRRLTVAGRAELERGGVSGRVEQVRERLADLTSHVTYNPDIDEGDVVVGTVTVPAENRSDVEAIIAAIDDSPLGPAATAVESVERNGEEFLEIAAPSSVTIDGVLLNEGIDTDLETTGVVEYHAEPESVPYDDPEPAAHGGAIRRFTDVIGDERATVDMVSLLIEARRTTVGSALAGEPGLLVADNREFPLAKYDRAHELAVATRRQLGGVVDVRRPREPGPFPWDEPGWAFASLTCVGLSECLIARCVEEGIATEWETLAQVHDRDDLNFN